jgi:hypothetical protein
VVGIMIFCFPFAGLDSIDYAFWPEFKLRHYRQMPHVR